MALIVSSRVKAKLIEKHSVSEEEVIQCFATREGGFLKDTREEHLTDPPSQWFVAETYFGRILKVVFIMEDGDIYIKTAYPANSKEIRIYEKYAM
ncbi:BrnT family toxin [Thiohalobacter thiocyanaticus]|uniref:ADP-ribosyl-(Dinitrogen reductase) hydrolase n=1 Tax=Thiohalobacter thiocyanaticus TaxID=585455 RepID=A0A426QDV8_9GAMM|nr:ADP-ribosyl-(dinitrogen reductase) hydrolase [Thiohalobacter thiocyanaticus]RRQ19921.1 ADP-ribosyl-(dinitrogen reductase) hydrolase [Thiohalobacter thiocyanaticus]